MLHDKVCIAFNIGISVCSEQPDRAHQEMSTIFRMPTKAINNKKYHLHFAKTLCAQRCTFPLNCLRCNWKLAAQCALLLCGESLSAFIANWNVQLSVLHFAFCREYVIAAQQNEHACSFFSCFDKISCHPSIWWTNENCYCCWCYCIYAHLDRFVLILMKIPDHCFLCLYLGSLSLSIALLLPLPLSLLYMFCSFCARTYSSSICSHLFIQQFLQAIYTTYKWNGFASIFFSYFRHQLDNLQPFYRAHAIL